MLYRDMNPGPGALKDKCARCITGKMFGFVHLYTAGSRRHRVNPRREAQHDWFCSTTATRPALSCGVPAR